MIALKRGLNETPKFYSESFEKVFHILLWGYSNFQCINDLHTTIWQQTLHKKWSFLLRISLVNVTKSAENCGLVTFTEEILNGKLHFLCSERTFIWLRKISTHPFTIYFILIQQLNGLFMEITKGYFHEKNSFKKSNDYYLFH